MREKAFLKYRLEHIKLETIVFLILLLMATLGTVISGRLFPGTDINAKSFEAIAIVILFMQSIFNFMDKFKLSQCFNISRKSYIKTELIYNLILSVGASISIIVIYEILNLWMESKSILYYIVAWGSGNNNIEIGLVFNFIFITALCFLFCNIGSFVVAMYYRLNNLWRILVSIVLGGSITLITFLLLIYKIEIKIICSSTLNIIFITSLGALVFMGLNVLETKKLTVK